MMRGSLAVTLLVGCAELFVLGRCRQLAGLRLVGPRPFRAVPSFVTVLPISDGDALNAGGGHEEKSTEVENHRDSQFAIPIVLGGQRLHVMLDTGSFRLTVSSKRCSKAECPRRAFDPAASRTYLRLAEKTGSLFGSGRLWAQEASDELELADYGLQRQNFWEISKLDPAMHELWGQTVFDGILGLSWRKTVPDAANETTLLEHLKVDAFTVCLGRSGGWSSLQPSGQAVHVWLNGAAAGTPSRVYWGHHGAHQLGHFVRMDVVGNQHWAVNLSNVSVWQKTKGMQKLACWAEPCVAVIDTGSSVVSAPKHHLPRLRRALAVQLGCENYDDLPDLHFHLGGRSVQAGMDVVLPARSYAKHVHVKVTAAGSNRKNKSASKSGIDELCEPRLGDSSFLTTNIPVWILGVPFLQEYMCEFDRSRFPAQVGIAAHPGSCPSSSAKQPRQEDATHLGAISVASELEWRSHEGSGNEMAEEFVKVPDARDLTGVRE
mmetsp:Transcript_43542/g.78216  ORF Transcript_43542/g.78216 Transcript_43542/m.78216 type:complete len:490 (-) Transcript_43542:13-1482(-)